MDNKIKTAYIRILGCKSFSIIKDSICKDGWCRNMPLDILNPHIKKFAISLEGEVMFRPLSLSKYKLPKKLIVIPYLYFYKQPFKKLSAVSWVYDSKDNFVFQFEPVYDENGNYVEGYKEFETSFLDSLNSKKYSPVKNLQLELINKITLGINGRPIIIIRGWGNLTGSGAHNFSSVKAAKIQDMFTAWLIYKVNDPKPDNINVFSYSNKNKQINKANMNEKESKDTAINKTIKPFLEEQDAEETYWFIRWVVLSRKYNKLKAFVKTIQDLDVVEVRKENVNLMSELKIVKENYARVKEELAAFRGKRHP